MFNRKNLKLAVTRAQDFDRSNFRFEFRDSDDNHYIAARDDNEEEKGGRKEGIAYLGTSRTIATFDWLQLERRSSQLDSHFRKPRSR